ncbi:hypothetical protein EES39_05815 [Streptomyces sp. ADI92-24]|uniref:DUF397 domain-containing protein n=1 Tax=unclassified Streptomyces TaxID=2593676 RepID=UPI000F478BD2|nr:MULTISPECIES: DUF397 domain-containing protein [unclassified Streptomyces]ROQ71671.1 uncharacterized protein DUF397 [Streptomyces sp. CEV 2-1]RPK50338.1 hypothetical protein EES39_05815 [Streptomyces sp. ADI92-24]
MSRTNAEVPESAWFKSSYSGGNETECVEAAFTPAGTSVRDSKRTREGRVQVSLEAWTDFVGSVSAGDLH